MEVKLYPESVLRKKAEPIREINAEVAEQTQQMLELMYESDGLGLAAPQVGWSRRLCTLDPAGERQGERIFINPIIVEQEGTAEEEEGCLSLPGIRVKVPRAEKVVVVAYTLNGERLQIEAEGLAARAWQHELDHLNGQLIIDKVPPTRLMGLREQLRKLEREAEQE